MGVGRIDSKEWVWFVWYLHVLRLVDAMQNEGHKRANSAVKLLRWWESSAEGGSALVFS